jgi:hypothetical protein
MARSCHTLLVRQRALCRPAPPSHAIGQSYAFALPGSFAPIQIKDAGTPKQSPDLLGVQGRVTGQETQVDTL